MKSPVPRLFATVIAALFVSVGMTFGADVVAYEVTNYWKSETFRHVYHIDFDSKTVTAPRWRGLESQRIVSVEFDICDRNRRLRFAVTHAHGYVVHYDWVLQDNGRVVSGAFMDSNGGWGPSVGRMVEVMTPAEPKPPTAPADQPPCNDLGSIVGSWAWPGGYTMVAWPGGKVVWYRGASEDDTGTWTETKPRNYRIEYPGHWVSVEIVSGGADAVCFNDQSQRFEIVRAK